MRLAFREALSLVGAVAKVWAVDSGGSVRAEDVYGLGSNGAPRIARPLGASENAPGNSGAMAYESDTSPALTVAEFSASGICETRCAVCVLNELNGSCRSGALGASGVSLPSYT